MSNRRGRRLASRSGRDRHPVPLTVVRASGAEHQSWERPDEWAALERDVQAGLPEDHPAQVLYLASALIEVARQGEAPSEVLERFVDSLHRRRQPWSTVFATAVGALYPLPSATGRPAGGLPVWSAHLDQPRVAEVGALSHLLGDWHIYLLRVEWVGAAPVTVVVVTEQGDPPFATEAWMVADPLDEVRRLFIEASPLDTIDASVRAADARVRVAKALGSPVTAVLPALRGEVFRLRPLLEQLLASMPEGGMDHPPVEWSEARSAEAADECLRSAWGCVIDDEERRALLCDLLTDAWEAGRDPMRWSSTSVSGALAALEWTGLDDRVLVLQTADCLRAIVRWSHAELDVPEPVTAEVLAAIDAGRAAQLHRVAVEALQNDRDDGAGGVYG